MHGRFIGKADVHIPLKPKIAEKGINIPQFLGENDSYLYRRGFINS